MLPLQPEVSWKLRKPHTWAYPRCKELLWWLGGGSRGRKRRDRFHYDLLLTQWSSVATGENMRTMASGFVPGLFHAFDFEVTINRHVLTYCGYRVCLSQWPDIGCSDPPLSRGTSPLRLIIVWGFSFMVRYDFLDLVVAELWFVGLGTKVGCLQQGDSYWLKPWSWTWRAHIWFSLGVALV